MAATLHRTAYTPAEDISVKAGSRNSYASSHASGGSGPSEAPQSVFFHYPHCGGSVPPARWAHTAAAIGSKYYVYGGVGSSVYDDLHILDTDLMVWRSATTTTLRPKERPGKRMCPATAVVGNILWLFGGQHGRTYVRDLYSLNTDTLQWEQHTANAMPSPRAGHSLTAIRDTLFLFGGQGKKFTNDLHRMHIPSLQWQDLQPTGKPPTPRRGHSLNWDGHRRLVLFGGSTATSMENSLHMYCLETNTWSTPAAHGIPPAPRTQHSATFVTPTLLLIFGGCNAQGTFFNDVHLLDVATCTWHQPQVLGTAPPPRYHHSCCLAANGKLLVYGGINSKQTFDGVILIETKIHRDISFAAEELFKMSGRTAADSSETSLAADMMKVQLRDLLLKRNMEEANIQASQRAVQVQEQLGRTREENDGLAAEVGQLRLMLAEADDRRLRLQALCSDLQGRLQREVTAAEAARVQKEQAQAEARSLATQLQASTRVQEGLEKELGVIASRYARTKLERDALLAGTPSRRRGPALEAAESSLAASQGAAATGAERGRGDAAGTGGGRGGAEEGDRGSLSGAAESMPVAGPMAAVGSGGEGSQGEGTGGHGLAEEEDGADGGMGLWWGAAGGGRGGAGAGLPAAGEAGAGAADRGRLLLRLRQLQGDREALNECSLGELRELAETLDVGGRVVRDVMIVKTVEDAQQRAGGEHASCSLCMEQPRGVVFNCGHQTCAGCSVRLVACPFCRADITAKIRMFDT